LKRRILFLCATNSLHSPMAEALLRLIDAVNFEASSAGVTSQPIHPLSVEVMKEIGLDVSHKTPRTIEEVRDEVFDFVLTLDEIAASQRHRLTAVESFHWKFENPLAVSSNPDIQRRAFRSVRDQIAQRLRLFVIVNVRPTIAERSRFAPGQGSPMIQAR
jgi:arsenate reductase